MRQFNGIDSIDFVYSASHGWLTSDSRVRSP